MADAAGTTFPGTVRQDEIADDDEKEQPTVTLIDIPDRTPSPIPGNEALEGRLDRCGFDAGGENGANWIFTIEGLRKVFSIDPRRGEFGEFGRYAENTLALSRHGDEIRIETTPDGMIVGFDNLTQGRTMEKMRSLRTPKRSSTRYVETAMYAAIGVMLVYGAWLLHSGIERKNLAALAQNMIVEGQRFEAASLVEGNGFGSGIPTASPKDGRRLVADADGSRLLTDIAEKNEDEAARICAEVVRLDEGIGRWTCTDAEGSPAAAGEVTTFAYRLR